MLNNSLQHTSPQIPTPLENVELMIEGNIDSDHFSSNTMGSIEIYYNVSIIMALYYFLEFKFIITNNITHFLFINHYHQQHKTEGETFVHSF